MANIILLFFGFVAILMIAINIASTEKKCPKNQVIYRYIPRTLEEEMDEPAYATDVFRVMFTQPSPWINNVDNDMDRKKELVAKTFAGGFAPLGSCKCN